jgi:nucleoside-triphosphatase THEP1
MFKIDKIDTAKSKIPLRACMKNGTLPRFPFSLMLSGSSGSGKTNLLMNILSKKEMYGGYFHYIIVYSPTSGKYDDMYKILKLPDENFVEEFSAETLENLISARKKLIDDKGIEWVSKNSRVLIILDDVISNRAFLESQTALTLFALLRHYLVAVCVMMQSYRKLPRSLRVNCNAVAIFPSTQSEIEVLLDEVTPAGIKKREFEKVIEYATKDDYSFLFINRHAKKDSQIRKNLDEIIDLNKFKKEKSIEYNEQIN